MSKKLPERLQALLQNLEQGLVERRQSVRLCLLAALAGEHSLLIGPPGTAKSALARRLHSAFGPVAYFERLLTRFTVPEELFGPLSLRALEEDRYERHTAGFLPNASIAFIDEVFKANSAILNALLTLLNEREFDNGATRMACPLISVLGATNHVPEDEVADAFFDRFLLRLPVEPVSAQGFARLLQLPQGPAWHAPEASLQLDAQTLQQLAASAASVALPDSVLQPLGELRLHCQSLALVVSDRRWVKALGLLRVAAASEGRSALAPWDLLLLPWLCAPDAPRQAALADWLVTRLGVHQGFAPTRLTRLVEAFARQLDTELQANDLDYDASGRLNFTAQDLAGAIGDAKGGAAALRMHAQRRRRYGQTHIDARVRQIDELLLRIEGYAHEVAALAADLQAYTQGSLWLDATLLQGAAANLGATATAVAQLAERSQALRLGFLALPRLEQDNGIAPEPLDAEEATP